MTDNRRSAKNCMTMPQWSSKQVTSMIRGSQHRGSRGGGFALWPCMHKKLNVVFYRGTVKASRDFYHNCLAPCVSWILL
jgi:hypothetical protein